MKYICLQFRKCLFFYIIIIGFGCKEYNSKRLNPLGFPLTINIKTDSIIIPPVLLSENKIVASKDLLVSMSIQSDTIYRVFSIPSCNYLGSFGHQGKGPSEFQNPSISNLRAEDSCFVVGDSKSLNIIKIPQEGNINDLSIYYKSRYLIPGSLIPINCAFFVNDSLIYGVKYTRSKKELVTLNTSNNDIGFLIDFPNVYPEAPKDAQANLYQKYVNISIEKEKIAMIYKRFPLLRIYNIKQKTITETFINEGPKQKEIIFNKNSIINGIDLITYYDDMVVTKSYIYALYQARSYKKSNREIQDVPLSSKQLHVFNWEGVPIAKIILKEWMKVYTISLDDKYIFFVNPAKGNVLYRYSLNELIKI